LPPQDLARGGKADDPGPDDREVEGPPAIIASRRGMGLMLRNSSEGGRGLRSRAARYGFIKWL
jgi:hypothetical protein